MKLLFASDSFKGSLTSEKTVELLSRAAGEVFGECECSGVPVADGGEGTVEAVIAAEQGEQIAVKVHGPLMEETDSFYGIFDGNPNVEYMGSVPYAQVQKRMSESDITVIVEGFAEQDINLSRYSLSTKAADALASGAGILTYGSLESGIIDYMKSTEASMVCTDKADLESCIKTLMEDRELQKRCYDQAIVMTEQHHNRRASCTVSEGVIEKAIEHMKQGDKAK